VRFSPDGRLLVSTSEDGTATVLDAATGRLHAGPLQHKAGVWFSQFSSTGGKVVTASLDFEVRVWSADGSLLATFPHALPVEYAEFSPDEATVVTAPGDHTARLWSVATGKQLVELRGHEGLVVMARFSPDGRRIITASLDGSARLWDAATGLKLADSFLHDDAVVAAHFSPDGRRVITASLDSTAKVWELPIVPSPIPTWLPELAEGIGGIRLDADGIPEPVSWTEYSSLKARWRGFSGTDPFRQWVERCFGEQPSDRVGNARSRIEASNAGAEQPRALR
jgi:dipeptidyl aminopeptidase/acylaminoacyl peptidase